MNNSIFFSVVIPTYNRAEFIVDAINSVLKQSYKDFEVIVVDDGSKDNTEEVVSNIKDSRLRYYKKKNEERGVARNTGVKLSKGDYINFFDSDDLLYPHHLEEAARFISANDNPGFFHLNYDIRHIKSNKVVNGPDIHRSMNDEIIFGNSLSCNGVFLKRKIAQDFPFCEDRRLSGSEDWHLWLKISSRFPLLHSNIVTSTIINHDERSVLSMDKEKLIKRMELFIEYSFNDEHISKRYGEYKEMVIAYIYVYISLHLAIGGKHKLSAINYLFKAVFVWPRVLFTRRFLGAFKNIINFKNWK